MLFHRPFHLRVFALFCFFALIRLESPIPLSALGGQDRAGAAREAAARDGAWKPLRLIDAAGRAVTLDSRPRRIVSLSPSVTEILFAIGAGDAVAAVTEYCNYPPEALSRPKAGGFSGATVSIETIAALKSDLVLLSAEMHLRVIPLLDRLSIRSFAVEPRTFAEVYETIRLLGEITGCVSGAEEVVRVMEEKIRRAGGAGRGERPGVFWELWGEPLMTAGGDTLISEAISLAGGRNIFEDLPGRWPVVSAEAVLLRRPGWILSSTDNGEVTAASLARRPGWSGIPAVRNGRIALVDADSISRYGPRLADAVLAIAGLLFGPPPPSR